LSGSTAACINYTISTKINLEGTRTIRKQKQSCNIMQLNAALITAAVAFNLENYIVCYCTFFRSVCCCGNWKKSLKLWRGKTIVRITINSCTASPLFFLVRFSPVWNCSEVMQQKNLVMIFKIL
jgi:hypothetical protein